MIPLPLAFTLCGLIGVIFGLAAGLIMHTYIQESINMRCVRVQKTKKTRPEPRDIDQRTPSGKRTLPY